MRETQSDTPHGARHARVIVLALSCCALAIAACGSSSKSTTTARSGPPAAALKFAACMRSHGVSNFPDPTPNAQGAGPTVHVDKHSPSFQTAQRACASPLAAIAEAKPRPTRARQLRQAACIRAHGVPNYPDPLPGGGFNLPSTINPQSPAFQRAQNACERP
jgi:hypothetical protein